MPEVFYDMELEDFFLMQKGFFNKRKNDDLSFAKVAFYIAAIHQNVAGKTLSGKQFISEWFGEKPKPVSKEQLKSKSKDMMERVRLTNKLIEEKEKIKKLIKNAERVKNSN